MKAFWEKFKSLRIWAILGAFFAMVGGWFVIAAKAIGRAAVCVGRWFAAVGRAIFAALKVFGRWFLLHWRLIVVNAAIVAVAIGIFLSLYLTLPVRSVEIEGEVLLLEGEEYASGLNIKATTKAGLVHREEVLSSMISGLDPDTPGVQEVTVSYKRWRVSAQVTVLGLSDVTLCVREGSLPTQFEPNDPFPTSGIFDLYYNGERIRSAPIVRASVPGFTTRLSMEYDTTLVYRPGLTLPYHYKVLEVIDTITPTGVLYAPQGVALSKGNALGNMRFLVKYKDGTEEYVMIYDDRIFVQENVLSSRDVDYQDEVTFTYKGVEIVCPVTAYHGELLAPKSVVFRLNRSVYVVGETFDYTSAYLEVVYERFGDDPVLLRTTRGDVLFGEWRIDSESGDSYVVPIASGDGPLVFDETGNFTILAYYNYVYSTPLTVRVISEEDATRVTDLETSWLGRTDGPPQTGQDLEFEDALLLVEYGFGYRLETVPLTAEMVTGYDKDVAGDQTLTITYEDFAKPKILRVGDPDSVEVTNIFFVAGWDDFILYTADELEIPEGAYLRVEIGYGVAYDNIPIEKEMVSGFVPHSLEYQSLTFTYNGLQITKIVKVLDDRTATVEDFWAPYSIRINVGDKLDLSGECTVVYSTGGRLTMTLAEVLEAGGTVVGEYDTNVVGTYPVKYFYPGCAVSDHHTWIYVEGEMPVTITGLRLDASAAKSPYQRGDTVDYTHMKLYLVYSDSSEIDISDQLNEAMFANFNTTNEGSFTSIVTYLYEGGAKKTEYNYSVAE